MSEDVYVILPILVVAGFFIAAVIAQKYELKKLYTQQEWWDRKYWDKDKRKQEDTLRKEAKMKKVKQENDRIKQINRERRLGVWEQTKATATRKPVRSQILGVGHDTKKTGTLGRAAVGAMTFGAVGAVVGAATAGSKQTGDNISFLVFFSNGDKEIETVHKNSGRYKELMAVLDTENPTA